SFLPPFRYLQVRVLLRSEDPRLSGEDGPKVWGIRAQSRPPEGWEEVDRVFRVLEEDFWVLERWEGGMEDFSGSFGIFSPLEGWWFSIENEEIENEVERWKILEKWSVWNRRGHRLKLRDVRGKRLVDLSSFHSPLRRLFLLPKSEVSELEVEFSELESTVPVLPAGVVYSSFDLSFFPSHVLEGAELELAVSSDWIEAQGGERERVFLYHFGSEGWERLPTRYLGREGEEELYSARTVGFSPFAIIYLSSETIREGGTTGSGGAQQDDGVYENLYEKAYRARITSMVAYSINTSTPQYRIWDGAAWGAQTAAQTVAGVVRWVVLKYARNRNEA
ncbi:MAG: hypothetical protein DSO02_07205, partial [Hadesarchaea archaeon]